MPEPWASYVRERRELEREALGLYRELAGALEVDTPISWTFVRLISRKLSQHASDIVRLQVKESQEERRLAERRVLDARA